MAWPTGRGQTEGGCWSPGAAGTAMLGRVTSADSVSPGELASVQRGPWSLGFIGSCIAGKVGKAGKAGNGAPEESAKMVSGRTLGVGDWTWSPLLLSLISSGS